MAKWFHDFSVQYAAGIAVVVTLAVIGGAGAIAYWAFTTVTGPALATIIFCLAVAVFLGLCGALWLKDRGQEVAPVSVEGQDLRRQIMRLHEQISTQQVQLTVREGQIANLEPLADWAKSLVDHETGSVSLPFIARFWSLGLDAREPFIEIAIFYEYAGVLELVVGETKSGRLKWEGEAFNQEPILKLWGEATPLRMRGPARGQFRLTQHVTPASAKALQEYINRGVDEVEFWSKELQVSLSLVSPHDGETVATGWLFGEYLPVKLGKYNPDEVRP